MQTLKPVLSPHSKAPFFPCHGEAARWAAAEPKGGSFFTRFRFPPGVFPSSQSYRWLGLKSVEEGQKGLRVHPKSADVVTLGNLCVDIVLNVPNLPPSSREERKGYFERLSASPPDQKFWEAGGNSNFSIAAARLGLQCSVLGHIGDEIYGKFLLDVLHGEGVGTIEINEDAEASWVCSASYQTLLCWVLVDPFQRHGFCSRADFSKDPAFSWIKKLAGPVLKAIRESKILFCNGYVFDELHTEVIVSALDCAVNYETRVFFDPGPRGRSLSTGTAEERETFDLFLKSSDVLLLTSEEAEELTGLPSPILAGEKLISEGTRTKWVIIKIGSKGSVLISESTIFCVPAFEVDVLDTVGCGDSFTAAIAFGYLQNMPTIEMLALANAVGAATATGCGAGRNVAKKRKVIEILKTSNVNEEEQFWSHLLKTVPDREIVFLSNSSQIGNIDTVSKIVSFRSVASKLVHELEKENRAFSKSST